MSKKCRFLLRPHRPATSVKTAKLPKSALELSLGRESKKSLSHHPNPVLHQRKQPNKQGFRTVEETLLGLSLQRPENTFRTLLKHSWAFWLFRHLCHCTNSILNIFAVGDVFSRGHENNAFQKRSTILPLSIALLISLGVPQVRRFKRTCPDHSGRPDIT